jgi:hypothetical protein
MENPSMFTLAEVIASFPPTFGLYDYPDETFRVSERHSYKDPEGRYQIVTEVRTDTGWTSFAKGTPGELRDQIVEIR